MASGITITGPHVEKLKYFGTMEIRSFDRRIQVTMIAINQITWIYLDFVPLWLGDETRNKRPGPVLSKHSTEQWFIFSQKSI